MHAFAKIRINCYKAKKKICVFPVDRPTLTFFMPKKKIATIRKFVSVSDFNNFLHFLVHLIDVWNQTHCTTCQIINKLLYLICSYMRRLAIQNSLKCTGTLQIFIDPHWYFILDTGLILRSIELFIYIQTNVCVNVNVYAFKK